MNEVFSNKSVYNDLHTRNFLNRLDNARKDVEEKQKRLQWNSKNNNINNNKTGNHFRSSSMEDLNSYLYKKYENPNNNFDLNNLKKNLRDELQNMDMAYNDSENEF